MIETHAHYMERFKELQALEQEYIDTPESNVDRRRDLEYDMRQIEFDLQDWESLCDYGPVNYQSPVSTW